MIKKTILKFIALGLCFTMICAISGCSKRDDSVSVDEINKIEAETPSEIDALVASVETIKSEYDNNTLSKLHTEDAVTQAMVMEGLFAETPDLYTDAEYKTKINSIYEIVNSIDTNKAGLNIEEGSAENIDGLKEIINRLNGEF